MTTAARPLLHPGTIAIYARVSTEGQASQADGSLDNQVHRCKQALAVHGHAQAAIDGVRIYREEGESGKSLDRPALKCLLQDAKAGRIRLLVFTELSRISRSVGDFLQLSEFLGRHGVEFVCLKERIDTTSAHGRLITVILAALGQFERECTAERTRLAFRDRSERGLFNGGSPPLGYATDPDRKGSLLVVPEQAAIVREVFRLYVETGSREKVAATLKERGVRRPDWTSARGRFHPGGPLTPQAVNQVLSCPVHAGLKEVNWRNRNVPEEEALTLPDAERYRLVPAVWEAIIDQETWDRAQRLLQENARRNGNATATRGTNGHHYVLSGLVRCAKCGTVLEGAGGRSRRGKVSHYYRHPRGTMTEGCARAYYRADLLEEAVIGRLAQLAEDPELLELVVRRGNEQIEATTPAKLKELADAKALLATREGDLERMMASLMAAPPGSVPAAFWERARSIEREVEAARGQVRQLSDELADIRASQLPPAAYQRVLRHFAEVWEQLGPQDRADLVGYLVPSIDVDGEHARIALVGEPVEESATVLSGEGARIVAGKDWLPKVGQMDTFPSV
ncbi:recombinase family protein [Myxococcota bacterium]|nr:recombinase family protein [Myxococcota bacterium]